MAEDLSAVVEEVSENTNKSNGTEVAKTEALNCQSLMDMMILTSNLTIPGGSLG